jgi:hypothetical protein
MLGIVCVNCVRELDLEVVGCVAFTGVYGYTPLR